MTLTTKQNCDKINFKGFTATHMTLQFCHILGSRPQNLTTLIKLKIMYKDFNRV